MTSRLAKTFGLLLATAALAACAPHPKDVMMAEASGGPPVMSGPGAGVQCQNGPGPVFDDPEGNQMLFKWCPSTTTPGYAHRDTYLRPNSGGPWTFKNNVLFQCSSQQGFIIARIGTAGYAGVCP